MSKSTKFANETQQSIARRVRLALGSVYELANSRRRIDYDGICQAYCLGVSWYSHKNPMVLDLEARLLAGGAAPVTVLYGIEGAIADLRDAEYCYAKDC